MDALTRKMAEYMLDHAQSAEELHQAVEDAVEAIEANPRATKAADLDARA